MDVKLSPPRRSHGNVFYDPELGPELRVAIAQAGFEVISPRTESLIEVRDLMTRSDLVALSPCPRPPGRVSILLGMGLGMRRRTIVVQGTFATDRDSVARHTRTVHEELGYEMIGAAILVDRLIELATGKAVAR